MAYVDIHDQPGAQRDFFEIPAVAAATATDDYTIWHAPFRAKIRDVVIIFDDAVVGKNVDTFKLQVYDRGTDGTGNTALTIPTALEDGFVLGVNATAFEAYAIYDPSTYRDAPVGTVLSVKRTKVGAGMDMPRIEGFVEYEGA